ncbi:MAG: PmoA family protein [Planctomycetales bacterium]|nr:PmoA family protein [Planctomycetales bacterium]
MYASTRTGDAQRRRLDTNAARLILLVARVLASYLPLMIAACCAPHTVAAEISFEQHNDRIEIRADNQPFATYVFRDEQIHRPYYCNLMSSQQVKVTRNHPLEPTDSQDHFFHSGLFFSFGDLNGIDFWHMNAPVVHQSFSREPELNAGTLHFTTQDEYRTSSGEPLARQTVAHTISATAEGIRIDWDLSLQALDQILKIGSKEEGGLAVRVATPIAVNAQHGGRMIDDQGRVNGKAIWGQQANWVASSAPVEGRQVGVLLMSDPNNARASFWHARDYGLLVANPFGPLNKPTGGMAVSTDAPLRLRFALLVFDTQRDVRDLAEAAYQRLTHN